MGRAHKVAMGFSALVGLTACSLFSSQEDGYTNVVGHAIQASGLPLANSVVAISCANRAPAMVPTDTAGQYGTTLVVPGAAHQFVHCLFGAPDSVNARLRADTLLAFGALGLPGGVYIVDLHEGP